MKAMERQIRIEVEGRDKFWRNAFFVEWERRFPARDIKPAPHDLYVVDAEWLADLERVAGACFSRVIVAPDDPDRRQWFRRFLLRRE